MWMNQEMEDSAEDMSKSDIGCSKVREKVTKPCQHRTVPTPTTRKYTATTGLTVTTVWGNVSDPEVSNSIVPETELIYFTL